MRRNDLLDYDRREYRHTIEINPDAVAELIGLASRSVQWPRRLLYLLANLCQLIPFR